MKSFTKFSRKKASKKNKIWINLVYEVAERKTKKQNKTQKQKSKVSRIVWRMKWYEEKKEKKEEKVRENWNYVDEKSEWLRR